VIEHMDAARICNREGCPNRQCNGVANVPQPGLTSVQSNLAKSRIAVLSPLKSDPSSGRSGPPSNMSQAVKRNLDRLSRFCTDHSCVQQAQTDTQTHRPRYVRYLQQQAGRIFALRAGDKAYDNEKSLDSRSPRFILRYPKTSW